MPDTKVYGKTPHGAVAIDRAIRRLIEARGNRSLVDRVEELIKAVQKDTEDHIHSAISQG